MVKAEYSPVSEGRSPGGAAGRAERVQAIVRAGGRGDPGGPGRTAGAAYWGSPNGAPWMGRRTCPSGLSRKDDVNPV